MIHLFSYTFSLQTHVPLGRDYSWWQWLPNRPFHRTTASMHEAPCLCSSRTKGNRTTDNEGGKNGKLHGVFTSVLHKRNANGAMAVGRRVKVELERFASAAHS